MSFTGDKCTRRCFAGLQALLACYIAGLNNSICFPNLGAQDGAGASGSLSESLLQASLLLARTWGLETGTPPHSSLSFLSPAVPGVCGEGVGCGAGL